VPPYGVTVTDPTSVPLFSPETTHDCGPAATTVAEVTEQSCVALPVTPAVYPLAAPSEVQEILIDPEPAETTETPVNAVDAAREAVGAKVFVSLDGASTETW
jgi:hypothetical protein